MWFIVSWFNADTILHLTQFATTVSLRQINDAVYFKIKYLYLSCPDLPAVLLALQHILWPVRMWPELEFHMLLWLPPLYQRLNVSSCHSTSDGGKVTLVLAQHLTCQCSIKQSVFLCSSRSWPRNAVKKHTKKKKKKKKTEATDSVTAFKFKCV